MEPRKCSFGALALIIYCVISPTIAHVALTYPPARKYDLDFLDSARTKAPCGMPKGNIKTTILSGSKFNVSWHLGYPHRGGFKIQLLDELERPVLDLTPTIQGSEFVANDATAQSFSVQLPQNYTCNNCTLRLIRQAIEWGSSYKFWSCADVDIKTRKTFRETCSGHGRHLLGRCKCDRLYYGDHCQFRDECWEDNDCGNHGKCIDVKATTAPRQQCYCQLGWFGPGCNKKSPVKTTEIDFDLYTERKLSDNFKLYWRIIKEHNEIEVVMVVNGTGYAALGWRPRSLTKSCKNWPQIGPIVEPNSSPKSEPEPIAEPESEPEPVAEPTSKPEPNAEPTAEPTTEPEPSAEPKSNPEPEPTAEPKSEPEPTTTIESTTTLKSKYRKSLYSRRSASPRGLQYHGNLPDGTVETSVSSSISAKQGRKKRATNEEPKTEPNSTSKQDYDVTAVPAAEPNSEPTPEPKSEPTSEPKSQFKPMKESKLEIESVWKPMSGPIAEPTSEPTAEPSSEPTAEPKSEPTAEPTSEPTTEPTSTKSKSNSGKSKADNKSGTAKSTSEKAEPTAEPKSVRKSKSEPTAEPKSEPTAEPKSEPTAEPKSEPTAEPKSEPTAEPKSEPTAEPKSEPTAEPKSEPTAEPKGDSSEHTSKPEPTKSHDLQAVSKGKQDKGEILNPYTPRHEFSPMDCTDIVIGSARNTSHRIADYYTRDRSTPRMDSFWGGKNDLTAAMGFEKDGVTTILFRKKLEATEPSDHSIEQDLMHVIWSQAQEKGKYVHVPKSGLEASNANIKDFYKPDELKYHGHGDQRGVASINFFDEKKKLTGGGLTGTSVDDSGNIVILDEPTYCGGEWKVPRNCNSENRTCEYSARWEYLPRKDDILFTITTSHTDTWTGIAFSNDEKMSQTDAILGWVDKTGRPFLMDTWISGYTQPLLDNSQEILNSSGRIIDGVTTLSFARKRISNDPKDLSFTNDNCLFMMFPVKGGAFNSVNKKIRKHEVIPSISIERICIKSCGNDEDNFDAATTQEPPGIGYNIKVKIVDLGQNFVAPKPGTLQFEELSSTINSNFKPVFNQIPGYKRMTVEELKQENNDVVALINVVLDKATAEKGRALSDDPDQDKQIVGILQNSIGSGRVGALKLDPEYFVFEPQSLTSNIISDTSSTEDRFFNLSAAKLYIVLGCIAALVLVAIVQASCTIYKAATTTTSSHKDHLIPNSAWKDYSAANTNYAFETYEEDKKQINGKNGRSETLPSKNQTRGGRPQGRPPSIPVPNQNSDKYIQDTRSLQRPRGAYPPNTLERSTFSLPRTAYDRHNRTQDMQPDFYFMPSQRKYSGEVVRVYVDYNNQPK